MTQPDAEASAGAELSGLSPDVEPLWIEIRRAAAEDSPTLAVIGCRKMLMHLGVEASKEDDADDPARAALAVGTRLLDD